MAFVTKKGNKYYPVIYDKVTKKKKWGKGFTNKKLAQKERVKMEYDYQEGNLVISENPSKFSYIFEIWKESTAKELYRSNESYQTSVRNISNHCMPLWGNKSIDKITTQDIQTFFSFIKRKDGKDMAQPTKKKIMGSLNSIFEVAINMHAISKNPCDGVVLASPRTITEHETWTTDQILYFLNLPEVKNSCFYTPLVILATTGTRRGETLALQWKGYDGKVLNFTHSLDNYAYLTEMKTVGSKRTVLLMQLTIDVIEKQKKKQIEIHKMLGESTVIKPWDYICTDDFNKVILPNRITRFFKKTIERNNKNNSTQLPVIPLKNLRHSFATNAVNEAANLKALSKVLGHSSTRTTETFYVNDISSAESNVIKSLESRIESDDKKNQNIG